MGYWHEGASGEVNQRDAGLGVQLDLRSARHCGVSWVLSGFRRAHPVYV